jgi:hypothetical protein
MSTFQIGFVIFPHLTQLAFTGPLQVLHRLPDSTTHIVARTLDPVPSDCELALGSVDEVPYPESNRRHEHDTEVAVCGLVVSRGQSATVFEL